MLDHPMSQFFIKKRQKGQKASKIQSRPDVCNKFFNGKKRMSNFLAAVFGFLYMMTACLITQEANFYYWNFLKTINLKYTFFLSLFSWPLFCKEALPDRNFTFWEWFHRILLLTQQHLSKLWQKGRVSVQGVKSLGGHFACLCRGFEFYEVKKMEILLHF